MDIKLSRHAKRRAKLYGIPESKVVDILSSMNLDEGEHEIVNDIGQKYPLKIVVKVEKDTLWVITNYFLKKERIEK
jgi:hypothetical protein